MSAFENIKKFVEDVWSDVIQFFQELPIALFRAWSDAVVWLVDAIPMPDFMQVPLQDLIPDEIVWFLAVSDFGTCLGIISAGILFYFLRRILTLGIW